MRNQWMESILESKIIAIIRNQKTTELKKFASALTEGGIHCIEVTFDQKDKHSWKDTVASIQMLALEFPGRVIPGAGTVITLEQLRLAYEAGAQYIISPNTDCEIIRETKKLGLLSFPGAMTPTEIVAAHHAGADIVKVFPVGALGVSYIKALLAPLGHIKLMAVGGVNEMNAADFIEAGCVGVGVGGNLVNKQWIMGGQWDRITDLAKKYVEAVR